MYDSGILAGLPGSHLPPLGHQGFELTSLCSQGATAGTLGARQSPTVLSMAVALPSPALYCPVSSHHLGPHLQCPSHLGASSSPPGTWGPRAASVSLSFLPAGVGVLLVTPSRGQSCGGGCQRWEPCRVSEGNGVESSGSSLFCDQAPHLFSGSPWIMAPTSIEVCCELPSSKAVCVSLFRPPRIGPSAHLIEETVPGGRPAQAVTHLCTWAFALTDPLPGTSSAFL